MGHRMIEIQWTLDDSGTVGGHRMIILFIFYICVCTVLSKHEQSFLLVTASFVGYFFFFWSYMLESILVYLITYEFWLHVIFIVHYTVCINIYGLYWWLFKLAIAKYMALHSFYICRRGFCMLASVCKRCHWTLTFFLLILSVYTAFTVVVIVLDVVAHLGAPCWISRGVIATRAFTEFVYASCGRKKPSSAGMTDIGLRKSLMKWQTEIGVSLGRTTALQPKAAKFPIRFAPGLTPSCLHIFWKLLTSADTRCVVISRKNPFTGLSV